MNYYPNVYLLSAVIRIKGEKEVLPKSHVLYEMSLHRKDVIENYIKYLIHYADDNVVLHQAMLVTKDIRQLGKITEDFKVEIAQRDAGGISLIPVSDTGRALIEFRERLNASETMTLALAANSILEKMLHKGETQKEICYPGITLELHVPNLRIISTVKDDYKGDEKIG